MKKIILPFLALLLMASCKKDESKVSVPEILQIQNTGNISGKNAASLIRICHRTNSPSNPWITLEISANALAAHLAHGDIVPDEDGDGYTKVNPCGTGSQDDCDDNNADINTGAVEICDGIDNNCNGLIDDNCITVVTICNQVWMAKNLEVTKYRNGDDIPQVQDQAAWKNLTTGAWCYNNNDPAIGNVYGKLYNWYAVNDSRGLAPQGWHVPSSSEWEAITTCLGGSNVAGGAMKEAGTSHWTYPNAGATNSSGFTALPGGFRIGNSFNDFIGVGSAGYWWHSTLVYPLDPSSNPYIEWLYYNWTSIYDATNFSKNCGLSVRCVKD